MDETKTSNLVSPVAAERYDFGYAMRHLLDGYSLARRGWNGKRMSVRLQTPDENSKMTLPYFYIRYPADSKTTARAQVPWVPSITDLMADDWHVTL